MSYNDDDIHRMHVRTIKYHKFLNNSPIQFIVFRPQNSFVIVIPPFVVRAMDGILTMTHPIFYFATTIFLTDTLLPDLRT